MVLGLQISENLLNAPNGAFNTLAVSWKDYQSWASVNTSRARFEMSTPSMYTTSFVGLSRPPSILNRVVFPEPEGPTIETYSPRPISKSIPLRARRPSTRALIIYTYKCQSLGGVSSTLESTTQTNSVRLHKAYKAVHVCPICLQPRTIRPAYSFTNRMHLSFNHHKAALRTT